MRFAFISIIVAALVVTVPAPVVTPGVAIIHAAGDPPPRPAAVTTSDAATIRVGVARDHGYVVQTVPLEQYVAGALAGEAARNSSQAALEALAITIRTFALANRGRHAADGFDLCDQTHCQVFHRSTPVTEHAAASTASQVLLYNGVPASVFYNASCGGHTERPSEVWPGAQNPPYLPSLEDDACEMGPAWSADLTASDIARSLRAGGFKGDTLRDLRIRGRNDSGRVTTLGVDGFSPDEITGQDLRTVVGRTIGWQYIKSTAFDLRRTSTGFHFSGHGSGHGVGLCVIGSVNLAAHGSSPEQILARYFPGLKISSKLTPPSPSPPELRIVPAARSIRPAAAGIVVVLPEGDEGEHELLQNLAARLQAGLAKQLAVAPPAAVTLRFHPTVESYQRATGLPWFTTAASSGTDVQLVPLTVLRQRGLLERTVRHELVHVLTASALADRPLWVREGAAVYFAADAPPVPIHQVKTTAFPGFTPKRTCPADSDFVLPVSAGALTNAYAEAAACFAAQIDSGKKWTEIK